MFHTGRFFRDVPCPLRDACDRPICLFSHNFTPVPAPAPTRVVPAKRHAPPELDPPPPSRPSSANAERPTKLRRTGPAAKPVAIPTASSSPVSKLDPCPIALPHGTLDRGPCPRDQCWAVKNTRFDAPGMSLASCPSSRNVVSTPPTRGLLRFPLPAACSHSGSSTHSLTLRKC
jgi:hypothetical protein